MDYVHEDLKLKTGYGLNNPAASAQFYDGGTCLNFLSDMIPIRECGGSGIVTSGSNGSCASSRVRCYRVEHYIKKHRMPAEKRCSSVRQGQRSVKIRGNVEVYCCYGISSPMGVGGLFHK